MFIDLNDVSVEFDIVLAATSIVITADVRLHHMIHII